MSCVREGFCDVLSTDLTWERLRCYLASWALDENSTADALCEDAGVFNRRRRYACTILGNAGREVVHQGVIAPSWANSASISEAGGALDLFVVAVLIFGEIALKSDVRRPDVVDGAVDVVICLTRRELNHTLER